MAIQLGSSSRGKRTRPVPVVNVTPLVDVALVVLIILMTVTPMMMKQFYLNLPKKDKDQQEHEPPAADEANQPLVLTVDKNGVVKINQTVIKKEELRDRLPRMLAAKTQKVLYFDAHDDLAYAKAVEVLDLSRLGGARSIAILTQRIVQ